MTDHPVRWLCSQCGDLDHLDNDGLCRTCAPEQTVEWWQVVVRVVASDDGPRESRWRIA